MPLFYNPRQPLNTIFESHAGNTLKLDIDSLANYFGIKCINKRNLDSAGLQTPGKPPGVTQCPHWRWHPGRTFSGKRRYFSSIAALTPLTPLTYKQNAVNAFIPTKKRRYFSG